MSNYSHFNIIFCGISSSEYINRDRPNLWFLINPDQYSNQGTVLDISVMLRYKNSWNCLFFCFWPFHFFIPMDSCIKYSYILFCLGKWDVRTCIAFFMIDYRQPKCPSQTGIEYILQLYFPWLHVWRHHQISQHFTYFRWTFAVDFSSGVYHPQDVPDEKNDHADAFMANTNYEISNDFATYYDHLLSCSS